MENKQLASEEETHSSKHEEDQINRLANTNFPLARAASFQIPLQRQSGSTPASTLPELPNRFPLSRHKSSISTFGWCPKSKHIDVDVEGYRMIRRRNSQRYHWYPVCSLLRNIITSEADEDCTWSVRINDSEHGLNIGVCLESQAKNHRFEGWYWAVPGHGHYLIWTGGSTFSHDDPAANNKRQQFSLGKGDIVSVVYAHKAGTLTFLHGSTVLWECRPKPAPEGDRYRGCVYLNKGDSVDLIDP